MKSDYHVAVLDIEELINNTALNGIVMKNPPPSSESDDSKELKISGEQEMKSTLPAEKIETIHSNKDLNDIPAKAYQVVNRIDKTCEVVKKPMEKITNAEKAVSATDSIQSSESESGSVVAKPPHIKTQAATSSSINAKSSNKSSGVPQKRRKSVQELLKFYEKKTSDVPTSSSSKERNDLSSLSSYSSSVISENVELEVIAELEAIVRDEEKNASNLRAASHENLIPDHELAQDLKLVSDLSSESWTDISSEKLKGTLSRKNYAPVFIRADATKSSSSVKPFADARANAKTIENNKVITNQKLLGGTYTKSDFKLQLLFEDNQNFNNLRNDHEFNTAVSSNKGQKPIAYTLSFTQQDGSSDEASCRNFKLYSTTSTSSYYSDSEVTSTSETDKSLPKRVKIKSTPPFHPMNPVRPVRTSFSQHTIRLLEQRRQDDESTGSSDFRLASTVEQVLAKSDQMFNGLIGKKS